MRASKGGKLFKSVMGVTELEDRNAFELEKTACSMLNGKTVIARR